MKNTDNTKKKINPRKLELIELSKHMRELVKTGQADSINDAIKQFVYEPNGHKVLKTLQEWNKEGKRIVKGSKALLLWSAPIKGKIKKDENEESTEDEAYKFWNVCYLFSNIQIEGGR
jgi:hypothetical protein